MVKVDAECDACDATGLYRGFMEARGAAVVCVNCEGSGCMVISYRPFIKRRGRRDIKTVAQSKGTFIATGVGAKGKPITYAEFSKGKMP
jgi:hypothetical protein